MTQECYYPKKYSNYIFKIFLFCVIIIKKTQEFIFLLLFLVLCNEVRSFVIEQMRKSTEITAEMVIFRRNVTHCISPYAIIVCLCVCVCV